jgi:hypothetical protein
MLPNDSSFVVAGSGVFGSGMLDESLVEVDSIRITDAVLGRWFLARLNIEKTQDLRHRGKE